jgi:lysozyme
VSAQVEHFARTVGEVTKGELPPVLDVEDPGQWKGMSRAGLTELVVEWLEGVQTALGAPPFVYLSPSFAEGLLDQESKPLARFPLWVAHWTDKEPRVPKPWTKWTFWQYSSKGHVDGITANVVDLDRFHGSDKDFRWLLR